MSTTTGTETETDPEALLDLAIASQDDERLEDAFRLHKLRMEMDSCLYKTDAVRLLGWDSTRNKLRPENSLYHGIFAAHCSPSENHHRYQPLPDNQRLGQAARQIFIDNGYCLSAGRKLLLKVLGLDIHRHQGRVFSGNSFFNHRHEALEQTTMETNNPSGLDVLLYMFLFGLAMDRSVVSIALGQASLDTLQASGLLVPLIKCAVFSL